jgi:putative endonuclease
MNELGAAVIVENVLISRNSCCCLIRIFSIKMSQLQDGYVYILKCSDESYYVGSTICINTRLRQHQNGDGSNHTMKRLPVSLVYCKYFPAISDAFAFEKQLQGWSRKKKEALMKGQFNQLRELSKCQNSSAFNYSDFVKQLGH